MTNRDEVEISELSFNILSLEFELVRIFLGSVRNKRM
jgi:hypothetical protein